VEKYGTDLSQLPITDDQIRIINKLAGDRDITMPKNRQEADELIEKLGKEQ